MSVTLPELVLYELVTFLDSHFRRVRIRSTLGVLTVVFRKNKSYHAGNGGDETAQWVVVI